LNTNHRVSVIIPVYNSERFLSNSIKSVLAQSYKNLEIIAIDDGLELSLASSIVLFTRLTTIWFATITGFIAYHFVLKLKINEE